MTIFLFSFWQSWVSWCWAPSLTRGCVCNLLVQLLLGLARTVTLGSKSRRTHDHILLSYLRLLPRNKVAQLYLRALGSLSVASYDSQGCDGGILTRSARKILLLKPRYDWRSVSQYVLVSRPLWDLRPDFNFVLNLLSCLCGAPSLRWRRVCLS
jgi:hypothetical protein